MAYQANPFLDRMSERTTSDEEFVRLFSPKILERLAEDAFKGAVHIFRSAPGGGKTTLLRALTPTALRAFWNARRAPEMGEAYHGLLARGVFDEHEGPQALGVLLSCASGYADLPPGASIEQEGLFRALLDCRVVLRSLRSLSSFLGFVTPGQLAAVQLEYADESRDVSHIPRTASALELMRWAEERERSVYDRLDLMTRPDRVDIPTHVRFESVLWLQSVQFVSRGKPVAPQRLLMIDDVHKLRRKQRALLVEELTDSRPRIPVWLAERSIALGDNLLAQGGREGREVREYTLEEIWGGTRGPHQFAVFAQNILDRRMGMQTVTPRMAFSQCLRAELHPDEIQSEVERGIQRFREQALRHRTKRRYREWLDHAERLIAERGIDSVRELYVTRILLTRDESKRQMSLEIAPLTADELDQRDSSQVQAAAEIFLHEELGIPYFFGMDRLSVMATNNVDELLSLAGALYEGIQAKQVLRKPELVLSPHEQERLLREAAKRKRDFIPKNHTEGTRAQRLLDAIGQFCREKTFLPNAPYAPGVTGVRLSAAESSPLVSNANAISEHWRRLRRVLSECIAENLLCTRESAATTGRESGIVFYLNRTLCVHYGLPLQLGGWQDVRAQELIQWMECGPSPSRRLEIP